MSAETVGSNKEIINVPEGQVISNSTENVVAEPDRLEAIKKIEELWADGFKFYVSQDYEAAAEKLSMAAENSVSIYGEFAKEGFQLFYYYGRSLVEVARNQAMLFNLKNADEDEGSSTGEESVSKEDVPNNSIADLPEVKENMSSALEGSAETSFKTDTSAKEKKLEYAKEDCELGEQTLVDTDGEEDDGEEVLNSAKLAWESLEVARRICELQEQTTEWLEKKADVLLSLGECMLVDENFGNALDEFNSALEIQKGFLEPYDRRIADTLFHIALSHKSNDDFENAAAFFNEAAKVFKHTIEYAEKKCDKCDIGEMKQILKDIQDQVQDSRESAAARKAQLEEKNKEFFLNLGSVDTEKHVEFNDISNLVQRKSVKRAAEVENPGVNSDVPIQDSLPATEPFEKKAKLDENF